MSSPSSSKLAQKTPARAYPRPLSPFFTYRPQITSCMSIFHRFTGVALCGGLILLVAWLVCLAMGKEAYEIFMICAKHPIGQLVLMGMTWSIFYHMLNGIRHLLWDIGFCLELREVYITGYTALAASFGLTGLVWLAIYWPIIYGYLQ
ncbi:MAG: succinate dehydrogenase, cytochrome b556 subunit [Alphaproteobacteria bacterium]|nr:succinate dehydrogenase, cytochrome b556 subunit [Alphaproteobacteria bacterium]